MHSHCTDHLGRKTVEARWSHKISRDTCHGSLHAQPCSAGNCILLISCQLSVICTEWIKLMHNGIVCLLLSSLQLFQQISMTFGVKPVYQMLDTFDSWCVIFSLPFLQCCLFTISVISAFSFTVFSYTVLLPFLFYWFNFMLQCLSFCHILELFYNSFKVPCRKSVATVRINIVNHIKVS